MFCVDDGINRLRGANILLQLNVKILLDRTHDQLVEQMLTQISKEQDLDGQVSAGDRQLKGTLRAKV